MGTLVCYSAGIELMPMAASILRLSNNIKKINNFIGLGLGSILSLLLVIGYMPCDLVHMLIIVDFYELLIPRWHSIQNYGLCDSSLFAKWLQCKLQSKHIPHDITFLQLYKRSNRILRIMATCLNTSRCVLFDHLKTPNFKVVEVTMAASCPIFVMERRYIQTMSYVPAQWSVFPKLRMTKPVILVYCEFICNISSWSKIAEIILENYYNDLKACVKSMDGNIMMSSTILQNMILHHKFVLKCTSFARGFFC